MFFNIRFAVAVGDNSKGDIDLFGLKISVFTPSAYASSMYDTGTCCSEYDAECIIGNIVRTNRYYKSEGSCR